MSTITLKNVPDELHASLKERAKAHQRSLNREVISTLMEVVDKHSDSGSGVQEDARAVREPLSVYVTQQDIDSFRNSGRA